jgi:hypothetical protein
VWERPGATTERPWCEVALLGVGTIRQGHSVLAVPVTVEQVGGRGEDGGVASEGHAHARGGGEVVADPAHMVDNGGVGGGGLQGLEGEGGRRGAVRE